MKTNFLVLLLLASVLTASAQENKFSKGDLGIRYGVYFGNGIQQQLTFSGMVSKHLEVGSSVSLSFRNSNNTDYDSTSIFGAAGSVPAARSVERKSGAYSVYVNPFVAYHFPVNSNLDIYTGGFIGFGVSNVTNNHTITTITATNITRITDVSTKRPVSFTVSPGIMLGCQYFFYKRLALGVQGQLAAGYSIAKGKTTNKTVVTNTGSDNFGQSSTDETFTKSKATDFSLATQGTIGVNLTFYFSRKAKDATTAKAM